MPPEKYTLNVKTAEEVSDNVLKRLRNQNWYSDIYDAVLRYSGDVWIIGGFVRDSILPLKSEIENIDFVTEGPEDNLIKVIQEYIPNLGVRKEKYRTVIQLSDIALSFSGTRKEKYIHGVRKPMEDFGTLRDNIIRRDFTINCIAVNLRSGEVVDICNGLKDIVNGVIRTPADPNVIFSDDPSRMLRAIRFSLKYNFKLDEQVKESIRTNAAKITGSSQEVITSELFKILSADYGAGVRFLDESGLFKHILPDINPKLAESDEKILTDTEILFNLTYGKDVESIQNLFLRLHLPLGKNLNFIEHVWKWINDNAHTLIRSDFTDPAVVDNLKNILKSHFKERSAEAGKLIVKHIVKSSSLIYKSFSEFF